MTQSVPPMLETPVVPISDTPPLLPRTGMKIGAAVAGQMAAAYATLFTIGMVGIEIVDLIQGHGYVDFVLALSMGVLALFIGIFPALLIGGVAGEIIGWLLKQIHQQLTFKGAFTVGVGVGIILLAVPNVLIGRELLKAINGEYVVDLIAYIVAWYLPCLFALVGLGWVGYQLNGLIPK